MERRDYQVIDECWTPFSCFLAHARALAIARGLYEAGRDHEARELFQSLTHRVDVGARAQECVSRIAPETE